MKDGFCKEDGCQGHGEATMSYGFKEHRKRVEALPKPVKKEPTAQVSEFPTLLRHAMDTYIIQLPDAEMKAAQDAFIEALRYAERRGFDSAHTERKLALDAGFELGAAFMRDRAAKTLGIGPATILLATGELSAGEMRAVKAVLSWMQGRIKALPLV